MRWLIFSRRNRMHVEVKNIFGRGKNIFYAGLLLSLAKRDSERIDVAIGMSAKLKPEVEFSVMREQNAPAVRTHDPRRTRHMSPKR